MNAQLKQTVTEYVDRTAIWIPVTIIALLLLPMFVTTRTFGHDWTMHLWAVRQQQWNIDAMGHPGLFVSAKPLGAFYPLFAFVGSGIYSVGGYAALAIGPILAYKLLYLVSLSLAYGGFTWLSLQFGLRDWHSQVPGAVLVTGAYFITDMVGRGDLGEFMALSSIPFLLASICATLRSPTFRPRHAFAVIVAVYVFTGSHNITLLWGSVFVGTVALSSLIAWGTTWRRPLPWKSVGRLCGFGAIGAGLNAWYLFPDVAYGLDTIVGTISKRTRPNPIFVHPSLLLNPLRPADHSHTVVSFFARDVRLSLPCLFFVWAVVVVASLWRRLDRAAKSLFVCVLALSAAFTALLVSEGPWSWLPRAFWSVQFTWRLDAYVLLCTTLLVMIALAWESRANESIRRVTHAALVAIVVFNAGAATWQVWRVRSEYISGPFEVASNGHFLDKVVASHYVVPPSWYPSGDFRDTSAPYVPTLAYEVTVPLAEIHGSSYSGTLAVPNGPTPFRTNISSGPRFLRMTGITAVGRTLDGHVVATRARGAPLVGPVPVTIRQNDAAPLRAGAIVSTLSALALAGFILWQVQGAVRRRRRAGASPGPGE